MEKMGSYYNVRKYASPEPTWGAFGAEETQGYVASGTLTSTNLLSTIPVVSSIDSLNYDASSIPTGTSLKIQFSQDGSSWYDHTGDSDWDTMLQGTDNSIDLSSLSWSGANFYYRVEFNSDGTNTPVLDEIRLYITAH